MVYLLIEKQKEKLSKEEKNTKYNLNKINYQWRSIMRDAKAKELLKDIEIMSQTFERIIDRKDTVIKALVKDLQEAEEQYAMAMRSNVANVENLIDLDKEQLEAERKKFENLIQEVKLEFDREREYILGRHTQEMNELTSIIYAMEKTFLDQENEANIEFLSVRDEIKNKNLEERQQLRVNLETKINETFDQFKQTMKNYSELNEDRERQFSELKEKDEKSAKEIDMQMRKIQNLTDNISSFKSKISLNLKESQETNNSIKEVIFLFFKYCNVEWSKLVFKVRVWVSKRYLKNMFHIYLESFRRVDYKIRKSFLFWIVILGEKFDQILISPT